jgi:hypothetical protein
MCKNVLSLISRDDQGDAASRKGVFMLLVRIRSVLESSLVISVILSAFICLAFPIPHAWSAGLGNLRLSYMQGDVQVRTGDTQDWVAAAANIPVADGDNIWSPQGATAEVQALDGTCVRIAENTSLSVVIFDKNTSQFSLDQGNAYVNTRSGKNQLFQLDTPSASIRVFGRAIFEADVSTDGYTDVSVISGSLSVESESGALTVSQGQVLSIKPDGPPRLLALSPPDEWTRWNQDRDRIVYQHRASATYLPPELQPYSYDLDQNGRWTHAPDYGYVWTPTVVVGAAWSPYRTGRWVWMRGDYVWVPYEPWGWCPYHYGRWAFIGSLGWCWVPPPRRAVYWAPAYVGWVRTTDHVAWVPLAPGETYYGRGYHGPHSVNITKININTTVISKPYRNSDVRDGVIVTTRESFLRGRGEHVRLNENPFVAHRASVGPPAIKPERQTLMPSLKVIPRAERPPEHLTTVIPRGMEKPLPAQRRPDRSVIRPAQPQQQMPVQRSGEPTSPAVRQRPERSSQPVPERGPSVERPLRQIPPARRETGPAPAKPFPGEQVQKPAQPEGSPKVTRPVVPGPVTPGITKPQPDPVSAQPQAPPRATQPEQGSQRGRPEMVPPIGRPERGAGQVRPEVPVTPARPIGPEASQPSTRQAVPEARPVAPPVRVPSPEVKPAVPPVPARSSTPEVHPTVPPSPGPSAPAQPRPASREEARPPATSERGQPAREDGSPGQQQQRREGR